MTTTDNPIDQPSFFKWIKLFGIVFLILGVVALTIPTTTTYALEQILGWLFFAGGIIQLGASFLVRGSHVFWFKLVWALLFLITGTWLVLRPAEGAHALALVVGILFLAEAVLKLGFSFRNWRNTTTFGWTLLSGIISLVVALVLITSWPINAVAYLGILIGINLLFNGLAALLLSSALNTPKLNK